MWLPGSGYHTYSMFPSHKNMKLRKNNKKIFQTKPQKFHYIMTVNLI